MNRILFAIFLLISACSTQKINNFDFNSRYPASEIISYSENVDPAVKTIDEVSKSAAPEYVEHLAKAKIVYVDYELVKKDFPQLKNLSSPEIDKWLLENCAIISSPQANQEIVNTKIPTTGIIQNAYRPPDYGRALVVPVHSPDHISISPQEKKLLYAVDESVALLNYLGNQSKWNGTGKIQFDKIMAIVNSIESTNDIEPGLKKLKDTLTQLSPIVLATSVDVNAVNSMRKDLFSSQTSFINNASMKKQLLYAVDESVALLNYLRNQSQWNGTGTTKFENIMTIVNSIEGLNENEIGLNHLKEKLKQISILVSTTAVDINAVNLIEKDLINFQKGFDTRIGIIDAKGVGAKAPSLADHGNGLATLGETIREFIYEKMVNKVFRDSGENIKTVGSYAVIDAGFNIKHSDGSTSPAGIILRQAHTRFEGDLLDDTQSLKIEKVLRKYGITSAGAYRERINDMINIQGTKKGAVVDFGAFLVVDKFEKRSTAFNRQNLLLNPLNDDFIQPNPSKRIPLQLFGSTVSGIEDPTKDNIWIWSHQLADSLRNGSATREDANQHLLNLLGPVWEITNKVPTATTTNCSKAMLEFFK
jgi:hypothetical protein